MATGALVIGLLAVPAAQAEGSGAAVGSPAIPSGAQHGPVAPKCPAGSIPAGAGCIDAKPVFIERCRSARLAVTFYRGRDAYWLKLRGSAPVRRGRRPRSCADARYLAGVWQRRAFQARRAYEREIELVVARLERGLAGTPMVGTGALLERYGRRFGISPYFMVATAATESSIGEAACSSNRFNVWGLASCGGSWSVPAFRSWTEAIAFYARFLAERWPGHSTPYSFRGYAVNPACPECWPRKVAYWMSALFGVPARTAYP